MSSSYVGPAVAGATAETASYETDLEANRSPDTRSWAGSCPALCLQRPSVFTG